MATVRLRGRPATERRKRWLSKHPLCLHCLEQQRLELAQEVDHIIPLEQDGPDDESNLQSLCKACHALKTASEQGYTVHGNDASGMPTAQGHHWTA